MEPISNLIARYPLLFRECTHPFNKLKVRFRGCECGEGWSLMIDAFCAQLMVPLIRAEKDLHSRHDTRATLDGAGKKMDADERKLYGDAALKNAEQSLKKARQDLPAIIQIKEKFGRLSIYLNKLDNTSRALIEMAQRLACSTCEKCGITKDVLLYEIPEEWTARCCPACADQQYGERAAEFRQVAIQAKTAPEGLL